MVHYHQLRMCSELSGNRSVVSARGELIESYPACLMDLRALRLAYKCGDSSRFQFKLECDGVVGYVGAIIRRLGDGLDEVLDYLLMQVGGFTLEIARLRNRRHEYALYLLGVFRGVLREDVPYEELFPWQKLMLSHRSWQLFLDDVLVGRVLVPNSYVGPKDVLLFEHVYGVSYPIWLACRMFVADSKLLIPPTTPSYPDSETSEAHLFVIGCIRFLFFSFDFPSHV